MEKKSPAMRVFIRVLSIINVSVCMLSQILLICLAVLMLIFGKKLAAGDFTLTEVYSEIMLVFITTFLGIAVITLVMLFLRQIRYDRVFRHYYRFTDVIYYIMTAVLPIFFWQMWMTYDFRVRTLIFALILQFMILLYSFFISRYLKQYIARSEKEPKKKKEKPKPKEEEPEEPEKTEEQ